MIKLHPYFTGQILAELQSSEWFKDIVSWAENHHEKIDGNGYPRGLKGEEIDKGGRIIALADVITALMENRPYREGMSVEKAFKIIREEIAPNISSEMFTEVEKHVEEVELLVTKCKEYSSEEYKKGIIQ